MIFQCNCRTNSDHHYHHLHSLQIIFFYIKNVLKTKIRKLTVNNFVSILSIPFVVKILMSRMILLFSYLIYYKNSNE